MTITPPWLSVCVYEQEGGSDYLGGFPLCERSRNPCCSLGNWKAFEHQTKILFLTELPCSVNIDLSRNRSEFILMFDLCGMHKSKNL